MIGVRLDPATSGGIMANEQQSGGRIQIGFRGAMNLLLPYAGKRVLEQVKSVALIVTYLLLFQTLVLGIAVAQAAWIAIGLSLVIVGLAFFMEGLMLGLMPIGEIIGLKLPQKSTLPVILVFALILGAGATFAEPAINVLRRAGSSVTPWDAPLLFLLLNRYAGWLVMSVAAGVGIAVVFGMVRFMYNLSLKPFLYVLVSLLMLFTIGAFFDENLRQITGLAWDCGAVTTGPVTVPLVLALGIGVCRIVGSAGTGASGFGVVTLASLFPALSVFLLGAGLSLHTPDPSCETTFFSTAARTESQRLFSSREEMIGYAFLHASQESQEALFDESRTTMLAFIGQLRSDRALAEQVFGGDRDGLERWAIQQAAPDQRAAVFPDVESVGEALHRFSDLQGTPLPRPAELLVRNAWSAVQAILPLSLFFLLVLRFLLRERLPRADEILLGLSLAVFGMMLLNIGIETGLSRLGNQVGSKVPSAFTSIELPEQKSTIPSFDPGIVTPAIAPGGEHHAFFFIRQKGDYVQIPFYPEQYDPETSQYVVIPRRGPLFGNEGGASGILVVLVFAFILGYGATLAEPALNALGLTVEDLTAGAFRKNLLMQVVALGVGTGIALGVAKIIWSIPLVWLIVPPYLLLLWLTSRSTEEFVNIGWDSAGVTTGPITVPLVLALGLGIGGQVGVVEGFGILAMASVFPILSVLITGWVVTRKRKTVLRENRSETTGDAA